MCTLEHVEIYPITLKVDYKAKHINYGNIKEGQLSELVNLFSLDSAEVNLSHVKMSGIKGFDKLMDRISEQWLPHIMNTQMPNMVSGVSPIRSIVNLSSGVADLVLLPVQQYKRDGRLIKGIQKGTQSFARATAIEAIKLGSRVASGTQFVLEHADGFFSTSQTSEPTSNEPKDDEHFVYTDIYGVDIPNDDDDDENLDNQMSESSADIRYHPAIMQHSNPSDITEGLQFAYQNLSKNLGSAAQSIFSVPASAIDKTSINYAESSSSGNKDATKAVMRAVPVAIIKPMIGITGAFQSILAGLRNSIDPVMRLQSEDVSLQEYIREKR
jgi:hypothetical protein